ncbi:DUF4145 domain-containing protein [Bacillus sp. JZ76]
MLIANINWQEISQFISSLLNSKFIITLLTSWPIAVVIIVLLLRRGILDKLGQLHSFNYKDGTAKFIKEEINKAKALNPKIELSEKSNDIGKLASEVAISSENDVDEVTSDLNHVAEYFPSALINTSWAMVEKRIVEICEKYNIKSKDLYLRVKELNRSGYLSKNTLRTIMHLNNIRNLIVHAANSIRKEDTIDFNKLCRKVLRDLEDI